MTAVFPRRTWIEIDLDALIANYRTTRALAAPCTRIAVVLKANAYGHGALRVAQCLSAEGADFFAVSCVREGLQLRHAGIAGSILVMGLAEPELLRDALAAKLIFTIGSMEDAQRLSAVALAYGQPASAHLKIDGGFHRLGLPIDEPDLESHIEAIYRVPYVLVEGLYAHLPLRSPQEDAKQAEAIHALWTRLQQRQCAPDLLHLVDSIGLVRYPQWHHDMARVGALLYGVRPSRSEGMPFDCLPTLRFCTTIARLHWADAGAYIGYDDAHPLPQRTRIATLPVGYGDGYPRAMSGTGYVSIRTGRAQVLGLVCMDQMMVDVTDIPNVSLGDEVELLGPSIDLLTYAAWANTNRNDALARLTLRPQRVYLRHGAIEAVDDALLPLGL